MEEKTLGYINPNIWWMILIQGILFILLGLAALISPVRTVAAVLFFVGIFVLINGVVDIISSIVNVFKRKSWGLKLAGGILSVLVGLFITNNPGWSVAVLVYLVGATFLIRGIADLFLLHEKYISRALSITIGILGIIAGLLLLLNPLYGGVVIFWIWGFYGIIGGSLLIGASMSLKQLLKT